MTADVLSDKARRLLAELALELATDNLTSDGWDDQYHKLTIPQQREYLEPAENKYAEELLLAAIDACQQLLAEHRDAPMDWLAWRVAPGLFTRTVRGRS